MGETKKIEVEDLPARAKVLDEAEAEGVFGGAGRVQRGKKKRPPPRGKGKAKGKGKTKGRRPPTRRPTKPKKKAPIKLGPKRR